MALGVTDSESADDLICGEGSFRFTESCLGFGGVKNARRRESSRRCIFASLDSSLLAAMIEPFFVSNHAPQFRGREAVSCIYCLKIHNLTKEHIIPQRLGGNIWLPKASCSDCAKLIRAEFEEEVITRVMQGARLHVGVKRKRRPRPQDFVQVRGQRSAGDIDIRLPLSQAPICLAMPEFHRPPIMPGGMVGINGMFVNPLRSRWGHPEWTSYSSPVVTIPKFMRFIAKMAHGYAFHAAGKSFKPLLTDYILSKDVGQSWHPCIGTDQTDNRPQADYLHHISADWEPINDKQHLVVRICLFACLGAPTYIAVTGI